MMRIRTFANQQVLATGEQVGFPHDRMIEDDGQDERVGMI